MEETVALLTGGWVGRLGQSTFGLALSSSEVFPSTSNCSPPSLPAPRFGHTLFTTAEPNARVAACGGADDDWTLSSCLVLDLANKRWEENSMGPLPQPRVYHAVVTLNTIGNFMIGGSVHRDGIEGGAGGTTDFLPQGSQQWEAGPTIPVNMWAPCAVVISETSFLAIYGNEIREYQVNKEQPTYETGWQEANKWPRLQTSSKFNWPACSKMNGKVVIAGVSDGPSLGSTEVLDLASRTIQFAGDLTTPREGFHIVTIRTQDFERALAMGGRGSSSYFDSVEEFDPDTLTWNPAGNLLEPKNFFGAVALPRNLIC